MPLPSQIRVERERDGVEGVRWAISSSKCSTLIHRSREGLSYIFHSDGETRLSSLERQQ